MKKYLAKIALLKKIYRKYRRFIIATKYYNLKYLQIFKWVFNSKEDSNFTYSLNKSNIEYLAHCISIVTGCEFETSMIYLNEPMLNSELINHIKEKIKIDANDVTDNRIEFGRRLGWYALVRVLKPKVIIETGVDKGLGSVLLCSAIKLNQEEGYLGKYIGTDINSNAGFFLDGVYKNFGVILYGDSIISLKKIDEEIDFFINDSDHSASYEEEEYETIKCKLSKASIILADNAHLTDKLSKFSIKNKRKFMFFKEQPENHWYPGAGIGISFK
jgi:hypothetical protein